MPSTPANGARITRSDRLARIWSTCARAASRLARAVSTALRATSCWPTSCESRCSCASASFSCAAAEASSACCCCPLRVTSGAPLATSCPLSKCTCCTVSLTLAVTVTASRARTVPSARRLSSQSCARTTSVATCTGAPPCCPPAPGRTGSPLPQADSRRASDRHMGREWRRREDIEAGSARGRWNIKTGDSIGRGCQPRVPSAGARCPRSRSTDAARMRCAMNQTRPSNTTQSTATSATTSASNQRNWPGGSPIATVGGRFGCA